MGAASSAVLGCVSAQDAFFADRTIVVRLILVLISDGRLVYFGLGVSFRLDADVYQLRYTF